MDCDGVCNGDCHEVFVCSVCGQAKRCLLEHVVSTDPPQCFSCHNAELKRQGRVRPAEDTVKEILLTNDLGLLRGLITSGVYSHDELIATGKVSEEDYDPAKHHGMLPRCDDGGD